MRFQERYSLASIGQIFRVHPSEVDAYVQEDVAGYPSYLTIFGVGTLQQTRTYCRFTVSGKLIFLSRWRNSMLMDTNKIWIF